jgi:hypothetical protein
MVTSVPPAVDPSTGDTEKGGDVKVNAKVAPAPAYDLVDRPRAASTLFIRSSVQPASQPVNKSFIQSRDAKVKQVVNKDERTHRRTLRPPAGK